MSVQKYFKCCYYFICLFSLKVSLVKANVDVPAVIITFLSVKLSTLSNAIMSITNKYVIPSQFQWLEKQSKSNAKNVKSIKFLYPKPNGSRNAIPFMTKNAKRNITSIANKKLDVTTYIKPRATTVAISSIVKANQYNIVTQKPNAIEPQKLGASPFKRRNVTKFQLK